jgi:transcriptional regulator with XRE-family HTH domain
MTTSQITSLSKPTEAELIPKGTLGYFRSRNKNKLYTLVVTEFKKSGLSQAELARRLGKTPDIICRWLAGPTNWTIDTVSDLLFAISGAEAKYEINYPLEQPPRNDVRPHWLEKNEYHTISQPKSKTSTDPGGSLRQFEVAS